MNAATIPNHGHLSNETAARDLGVLIRANMAPGAIYQFDYLHPDGGHKITFKNPEVKRAFHIGVFGSEQAAMDAERRFIENAEKAARKPGFLARSLKWSGKSIKYGAIAAAVGAGLGYLALVTRRNNRYDESKLQGHDAALADIPIPTPVMPSDLTVQPQTMMGMAPTPGAMANKVLAGRGLAPAAAAAINPAMTAVPEGGDLNSAQAAR